jgi:2-polyprenyl-3-methyl-5-hydroxy-6-metoxy-1,4-benzoquinol methylase
MSKVHDASVYGDEYAKIYHIIKNSIPNRTWSILANQIANGSSVLEFGSANGYMTRYLKEELGCKICIAEIDPIAAKKASRYATDCFIGDIETCKWANQWKNKKFDVILFADVLEHLRQPEKVLQVIRSYLHPEGVILASIPNICHNSVLIELWNNRFNYTKTGLLDKTHLRFFCEESAKNLFTSNGFEITHLKHIRIKKAEIKNSLKDVPWIMRKSLKKRKNANTYQFVITAKLEKKPHPQNLWVDSGSGSPPIV